MAGQDEFPEGLDRAVAGIMAGIGSIFREEAVEAYTQAADDRDVRKAADALRLMDCIGFSDAARSRMKPFEGLLASRLPSDDRTEFLFMNAAFVEMHLERMIQDVEGSYAYVDKARHVLRRAASASALGIRIDLGPDDPTSYWIPKKVFRTHEEIMNFVDALHELYYGHADAFVEQSFRIRMANGRGDEVAATLRKVLRAFPEVS